MRPTSAYRGSTASRMGTAGFGPAPPTASKQSSSMTGFSMVQLLLHIFFSIQALFTLKQIHYFSHIKTLRSPFSSIFFRFCVLSCGIQHFVVFESGKI